MVHVSVRVFQKPNVDADHFLLESRFHVRISNARTGHGEKMVRYNAEGIKDQELQLQ